ncbi:hypothetical protein [Luteimonas fraxinea]|uniref:Uncharacterized protein n=1 Tax=Luteimonas fraxinea TaxID=2901869 RepID=A0ABS8UDU3_9GAMM|nr:hypothetical protein [Luteimonas fraxinea]MCD9097070.1 hypothetical protein [Luteimonas fraxinea]
MLTALLNSPGFFPGLIVGSLIGAGALLAFLTVGDAIEDRAFRKALEQSR